MGCGGSKAAEPANGAIPVDPDHSKGEAPEEKPEPVPKKAHASSLDSSLDQTVAFLSQVQLFKRLPAEDLPKLANQCVTTNFQSEQVIIKQGDQGREFFIIKEGEASVLIEQPGGGLTKVATLKPGDYFGENALLRDEPRTATITAETELTTYSITQDKFKELGLAEKLQFANRKAVGGGRGRKLETRPPSPKTPAERDFIADALRANQNLQTMVTLDESRVQSIIDVAWKETVAAGTEVISEGDLTADYFYIVQEGTFEIFLSVDLEAQGQSAERAAARGSSKYVSAVSEGGSFGELALLYLVPRAATVKAKTESTLWVIDRQKFKSILMKASDATVEQHVKYLEHVTILESLLQDEKQALAQALVEMSFAKDEVILQQGEPGNTFYILYSGEVAVIKDCAEQTRLSASKAPQFFGERALLNNETRAASVVVKSHTAKALALDRDSFDMLLGPLEEIIRTSQEGDGEKAERKSILGKGKGANPALAEVKANRPRVQKNDLSRIGLLGCGGFGVVELYEHKVNGETYAMKALSKGYIVKMGMQDCVMNEKQLMLMLDSDFVIKLYETYSGNQTLYFLMEAALGGELYATYNRKGFHGSERHALFYVAGTVLAFEHIHEKRIIYRDLKPENLLLTETGHLKVTDMGLAKFAVGRTYTTCGTPDYFAPELIATTGHTKAVDWWGLGILIFELMAGHPPFESASSLQTYTKVMRGIGKVQFPAKCHGPVGELIRALLQKEPSERLAMRPGGVQNIKDHAWYKAAQFDWKAMADLTLDPPYKPMVKSKKDIANFSARKEDMPTPLPYTDTGSDWDKAFAT
mmetsp:Transcript_95714/g.247454  ORF Transcript_95714/g.247454 Transcript_95714/m.247454 type:complete len:816 (+) Transcript_95714:55-2502(+)